ncbi:unnamed protein product [Rhizoctonia solani]|uniref:Uncharacterized protein n=1 Tax=Rhizoctonia solani TaxID=456999 RepID=A0A8H3DZZ1_9AGAM|nr:unnamed protein product [Rhizoctonia solani]
MHQNMFSSGDSDVYVPSEVSSSATTVHTPPRTPRKPLKMVMEVVIPVYKPRQHPVSPVSSRPERRSRSIPTRDATPARSDSSVSLGTFSYTTPPKKRIRRRKRPSAAEGEEEQDKPRKRVYRKTSQWWATIKTSRAEHTAVNPADPAAPVTIDVQPPSTSPSYKPRLAPTPKINLESARLEAIQAQESARGYDDFYHHWPTPPGSNVKTRTGGMLNTPATSSPLESRVQLYASNDAGSSTGLGTREYEMIRGTWARVQKVPPSSPALLTPTTADRSYPSFADPVEAKLGTLGSEVNRLARIGLQTALGELVERYDYPFESISKLYRLKGCLEETEMVLQQLRSTEDELRAMTDAAFGAE